MGVSNNRLVLISLVPGLLGLLVAISGQPSPTVQPFVATGEHADVLPPVDQRFAGTNTETPDFQRHVSPLLGRLGCNGRACHGSFQGQGGFRLSLFGYDFDTDHQALLEDGAWRVDLDDPAASMILTKPTDADFHEGGLRYEKNSWQYRLIENWIAGGGAEADDQQRLLSLDVTPTEVITSPEQRDQLQVVATWSNGTREDVTPLARFQSNDPEVAGITENGLVSGGSVGDTHVIVFYDNAVESVPVLNPVGQTLSTGETPFANPTRIDQLVIEKLNKLGIRPSELADDATFLRRASLDISGTLPSPEEIREFLADASPDKRTRKIDELLESPAYAAWWTTFLCDLTGNSSQQLNNVAYGNGAARGWYDWIYRRVEKNVPYDQIVSGLVMSVSRNEGESYTEYCQRMSADAADRSSEGFASGDSLPYYWMRREFREGDDRAISFAHAFLGVRLQCAQCHKHPFDQWTQDDFTQFSRFFTGVSISPPQRPARRSEAEEVAALFEAIGVDPKNTRGGNLRRTLTQAVRDGKTVPFPELVVNQPRRSRDDLAQAQRELREQIQQATTPEQKQKLRNRNRTRFYTDAILLGSDSVQLSDYADAREPALNWMLRDDNPYFAKAIVNRVWARYFGVGIVDPPDDLNLANPPSNGALLDYLASEFVANGYDLKWLHREITGSHIYQLSWQPNETNQNDRRNFSRALPRRLPAEVMYDAVTQATAASKRNKQFREQTAERAIAIPGTALPRGRGRAGNPAFALRIFGKSQRVSTCDCERSDETSLIQTVYLQNDRDIHTSLAQRDGWLGQLDQELGSQPLTNQERRQLVRQEERRRQLRVILTQLKNRGEDEKAAQTLEQVRRLEQNIAPLRQRARVFVRDTRPVDREALITEAWLRTLSRPPTDAEIERCQTYLAEERELANGMRGIMWSLLNTKEFIVNH